MANTEHQPGNKTNPKRPRYTTPKATDGDNGRLFCLQFDQRLVPNMGMALRAFADQLAADAKTFAATVGHERVAVETAERAAAFADLAELVEA